MHYCFFSFFVCSFFVMLSNFSMNKVDYSARGVKIQLIVVVTYENYAIRLYHILSREIFVVQSACRPSDYNG